MDLEQELPSVRSKAQVQKFAHWTGNNKKRFGQLMEFFLHRESELAKKSAWVAGHCVERHPSLALPWLKPLLVFLQKPGIDHALKRNALRILRFSDIPLPLKGLAANVCFKLLASLNEPIAVRAFSISVMAKIAEREPELRKELELVVRQLLPYGTAAFRSQAKRVLQNCDIQKIVPPHSNEWDLIQDWLQQEKKVKVKVKVKI